MSILVLVQTEQGALHPASQDTLARAGALGPIAALGCEPETPPQAIERAIRERAPALVLAAHTTWAMDTLPWLAARLDAPLVTDAESVAWEGGTLSARRRAHGGKLVEALVLEPAPLVMATLRPGSATPAAGVPVEPLATAEQIERRRRLLLRFQAETADVDVAAAEFIVSIGRGVGKEDNIEEVAELARAIGATLACSRPVADAGWLPKSRQVGTSGKTVRPRVYLALGISGAYQHVAGMRGSDTIIAVNSDPDAPIFDVAHVGLCADLFDVLPLLREHLT